ncbi:carbamoylphosphate synthase large subunit [Chitinophaga niastensis]|uniref:Carbamoylphosphate synthase large subunit n=1 Tax=Chitinophaga niastensis TaxID=536980 RepID=A0A2P8HRY4_CHINA|nr:ATP-grasp domain-containing protein [Chitinophaga niastensis]PSL48952.1 carbamoylphosphate synthase large subunit [Chitinophaga niastensis]
MGKIKVIRSAVSSLPSAGIIKLLQENDFYVIGSDITEKSAGRLLVDDFFIVDKAVDANKATVCEQYLENIQKTKAKWIISGPENEIVLLSSFEQQLLSVGCRLFHPGQDTLEKITDKYILNNALKGKVPLKPLCMLEEYSVNKDSFEGQKLVVKPRKGRGSNGVHILQKNSEDMRRLQESLPPNEYIVQEFIPGQEYSVDCLFDNQGGLLNAVVRERLAVDSGVVIISRTIRKERILEYISGISSVFSFRGFNCIQFREHEGDYFLTDINPRIGGGSILSLRASDCMLSNFISLLRNEDDKLVHNNFDVKDKTMYRYYEEIYE